MKKSTSRLQLLFLCLCLFGTLGGNWPQFRGPDGAGQSDDSGIPAEWTKDDYLWRVSLPGIGQSSPVVWEDQVVVTSAEQTSGTRIIRALRSIDGELLWETRLESAPPELGRSISYDTASPAIDGERVYLTWSSADGYFAMALNRCSGEEVWRRRLGPFRGEHVSGASPVRFGDLLIVPNDQTGPSSTVALECSTGEQRWKIARRTVKTAYATPIIYRREGGSAELILASTAHGVSSVDPVTGALNWELADLFGTIRVVGSPVIAGGYVFSQCGSGGAGKRMFAIRPPASSEGSAEVAYELRRSLPYVSTPVAHEDWLFVWSDSGVVSCIDTSTGKIVWRERVGGDYLGSPVRIGNRIYCISRDGEVVVLAAEPEYRLLGRVDLEEGSHSTPATADGVMYLRTFSHLMAIGGARGRSQ